MRRGDIRCAFSPVIDGKTLRDEPKEAVKSSSVPLPIGSTSQEGNLFLHSIPSIALPFVAKFIHLNGKKGSGSYKQRACDALTEHICVRPQLEILNEYSGSAWRYLYDHPVSGNSMGCFHASELPVLFVLNMLGIDGEKDDTGAEMRRIWGEFAKKTNPGWENGSTSIIQ